MEEKKFLLFAGGPQHPKGGAYDFKGSFETAEKAMEVHDLVYGNSGWANIFDLKTEAVIKHFSHGTW